MSTDCASTLPWHLPASTMTTEPIDLTLMTIHDLRGPLHAILASVHTLHTHLPPEAHSPLVDQALGAAQHSAEKLLGMVNDLLTSDAPEAGSHRERVLLSELVKENLADVMPLAREYGIALINDSAPAVPEVMIDRQQISRVLANLLDNALKFTPSGGQICVRCEPPALGASQVRLSVADTGPGVPASEERRIFQCYTQLREQSGRRPGTGLGLAWCQFVVRAHGGDIWAEARPAGGSVFYVTLPVSDS